MGLSMRSGVGQWEIARGWADSCGSAGNRWMLLDVVTSVGVSPLGQDQKPLLM